jgi:hypothetical protein
LLLGGGPDEPQPARVAANTSGRNAAARPADGRFTPTCVSLCRMLSGSLRATSAFSQSVRSFATRRAGSRAARRDRGEASMQEDVALRPSTSCHRARVGAEQRTGPSSPDSPMGWGRKTGALPDAAPPSRMTRRPGRDPGALLGQQATAPLWPSPRMCSGELFSPSSGSGWLR